MWCLCSRHFEKAKRRKPLQILGFQRYLSSFNFAYLKPNYPQRGSLENRLPKRHGGSNPSSCATSAQPKGALKTRWLCIFLQKQRVIDLFCGQLPYFHFIQLFTRGLIPLNHFRSKIMSYNEPNRFCPKSLFD